MIESSIKTYQPRILVIVACGNKKVKEPQCGIRDIPISKLQAVIHHIKQLFYRLLDFAQPLRYNYFDIF